MAYQDGDGSRLRFLGGNFETNYQYDLPGRALLIPCGKCIGCRDTRARGWAIRCMHEARMHKENAFITLTYNDDNYTPGLNHEHFQQFMRALRHKCGPTRYFMCGEYGTLNLRPHFHALLFGRSFHDMQAIGKELWRSPLLEKLWTRGYSSIGNVSYESARYVAGYCAKELKGDVTPVVVDKQTGEYVAVKSEYGRMSLKPGIGHDFIHKYWREIYQARDGVVIKGKTHPPPKYYDRQLEKIDYGEKYEIDKRRYENSKIFQADTTKARLEVREKCKLAKLKMKRKKI